MLQNERLHNNYDFLRLLAALCIAFTHSFNLLAQNNAEPLMKLTYGSADFSFIGLSIFFSISGYLIAKSAVNSPSFTNYLWKRFLRIQPLLIIVCILSVFLLGPFFTVLTVSEYFSQAKTWLYFRNILPFFGVEFYLPGVFQHNPAEPGINGSLWTLVAEERLYVITSILFLFKQSGKALFIAFVLSLNLVFFSHLIIFHGNLLAYLNGTHVFYSLIFLNASVLYLLNINFGKPAALFLLFFGATIAVFFLPEYFTRSLQTLLIPVAVIAAANIKGFTNTAGRYGDLTYGIYIFSFPVQQMLIAKNTSATPLFIFMTTLAVVIPAAFLSWHLLEKRMLALKEKVK